MYWPTRPEPTAGRQTGVHMGIVVDERWLVDRLESLQDSFNAVLDAVKKRDNLGLNIACLEVVTHARAIARATGSRELLDG